MPTMPPRPPQIGKEEKAVKTKVKAAPVVKAAKKSELKKSLNRLWQQVKVKLLTPPEGETYGYDYIYTDIVPRCYFRVWAYVSEIRS